MLLQVKHGVQFGQIYDNYTLSGVIINFNADSMTVDLKTNSKS